MQDPGFSAAARGRSLCLSMLRRSSEPLARCLQAIEHELGGAAGADFPRVGSLRPGRDRLDRICAEIAAVDVAPLAAETSPVALLIALGDAVDSAMPWQPLFICDALAAFDSVRIALEPAAAAIASSPAARWWDTPLVLADQYEIRAGDDRAQATILPARKVLADLREAADHLERLHRDRPDDPADEPSGAWWSIPIGWVPQSISVRLPCTSRRLPEIGAVELAAQEDSDGPTRVRLRRIQPIPERPRVFEVRGPADWSRLVSAYPFEVSRSRRGVWWSSTGIDSRWFIPDWLAVARDYDAIHVSVNAYLMAAGEPLPVPDGNTVLAGWNPDCTYWLCDVTCDGGEAWVVTSDTDMAHWAPATG